LKLTKKAYNELAAVYFQMKEAREFIRREDIHVCRESSGSVTTEYYNEKSGKHLTSICKDIGSDLQKLDGAIRKLGIFLNADDLL